MMPVLSACLVICHCGDEVDLALRCIQNADLEVSVFLSDNSPEELTAERLKWSFPGIVVLPQEKNVGLSRAYNAVLPQLQSRYHLMMNPGVSFNPSLLRQMVSYMDTHPNIAVLSPRFLSEEGEELFFPRRQISIRFMLGTLFSGFGGIFRKWHREYTFADNNVEIEYEGVIKVGYVTEDIKTEVNNTTKVITVKLSSPEVFDNYIILDDLKIKEENNILNPLHVSDLPTYFASIESEELARAEKEYNIYAEAEKKAKAVISEKLSVFKDYKVSFE